MNNKKLLIFDLDQTLAESKQKVPEEMLINMVYLLEKYKVAVISGAKFDQFNQQFLNNLIKVTVNLHLIKNLHILPICGAEYFNFNGNDWQNVYKEHFSDLEKDKILYVLNRHTKKYQFCGINNQIEDRGGQITWSALGQTAHPSVKKLWDPQSVKRNKLREEIIKDLPEFEVRIGGSTSIDITKKGIDKSFGLTKLISILQIDKTDCLFFGDALHEGGNDFPVKQMGIECIEVVNYKDTIFKLENLQIL